MGKLEKSLNNEKYVMETFKEGTRFLRGDNEWVVDICGKPVVQFGGGEPKTDVFVRLICTSGKRNGDTEDYKFTIKKPDANFLQNKASRKQMNDMLGEKKATELIIAAVRDILGRNMESLIKDIAVKKGVKRWSGDKELSDRFNLGYRWDITKQRNGKRSYKPVLTDEEKFDILSGRSMPEEKRNAKVNGQIIENSGVANYYLETDLTGPTHIDDLLKKCKPVDDPFLLDSLEFYITLKALNYYYYPSSHCSHHDGPRPLAIYTSYDDDFNGTIKFDINESLITNGNDRAKILTELIERKRYGN